MRFPSFRSPSLISFAALISCAATALAGAAAQAQSPLDPLVQQALQNNPGLKAQRAKVAAARQVPSQMKSLPDPTADIEFMNIALNGSSGSKALTEGVSLGVTQVLPYPGKRGLAAKAAEGETLVQEARLAVAEWMIRSEVIAAAYRYRTAVALLQINAQTLEALRTTVESALARYSTGGGNQADVLLAQSSVTKTTTERRDLEKQREVARARIESLIAAPVDSASLAAIELPQPAELPALEKLLTLAGAHAPEVAMAQAEATVADAGAEVAKKNFKPDFMVGGRFRYKDMTMDGQNYLTAMFGMTLPFFHRKGRYQPALEEALQRKQGAVEEVNEARNTARYKLAEAYQGADRDAKVATLYEQGLLTISDLSTVWAEADIYESDLRFIKVGMPVTLTLPYWPGKTFPGEIAFLNPFLDPQTRTLQARLEVPNPELLLKPEMYGDMTLSYNLGERLAVPSSAVMRTGKKSFVFVKTNETRLTPAEVTVGERSGEYYEVLSGLKAGDQVVTSANFLVDSESSLKAALQAVAGK